MVPTEKYVLSIRSFEETLLCEWKKELQVGIRYKLSTELQARMMNTLPSAHSYCISKQRLMSLLKKKIWT